jgi:hypothetical protein
VVFFLLNGGLARPPLPSTGRTLSYYWVKASESVILGLGIDSVKALCRKAHCGTKSLLLGVMMGIADHHDMHLKASIDRNSMTYQGQ